MAGWHIGERIDNRWEVHRILRGGMAIVYVVYDHEWHEVFAAKTFQPELFARDSTIGRRFEQEARAWIGLDSHPNIAQARMVHEIQGCPVLFLEYVPGGDLSSWIGSPRLTDDIGQVVGFALQFCDGMMHARANGIAVHRDIKPQNCLVGQNRTLKITDFGLAKIWNERDSEEGTAAGAGTPAYMAPEQFKNANGVDVRADVYSFGVMLFEMATGRLPFDGGSWLELHYQHETELPPRLAGAHENLANVVERCLAKDPASRFGDFAELRRELAGVYETCAGREAPPPPSLRQTRAEEWINKGLSLHTLRRYDDALRCYEQGLSLNASLPRAISNKGVTLGTGLGRWTDALCCFDEALRLDPDDVEAWSNKGMTLRALGRARDALICYDRALVLNPREDSVWSNRGVALLELGQSGDALRSLERAVELNPRSGEAWCNMGQALIALRRAHEALECFDRALELRPFDHAWLNKGIVLAAQGRLEEAVLCYEQALALNPAYAKAWISKGNVFNRLDRFQEAIACYDHALRIDPQQGNAWYNKAVALLQCDDPVRAAECLTEAERLGHAQARTLLNQIG